MNRFPTLIALLFVSLFLANCKKSTDAISPDAPALLARKWTFSELAVQTDAKRYAIPNDKGSLLSDDNVVTFAANGTYTYTDNKVPKSGKWVLSNSNQTLTMTDADATKDVWQVTTLTSTTLELGTIKVDLAKTSPTDEESGVTLLAALALSTIDKKNGGTVDFTKEPTPKTVQVLVKAVAQ